MKHWGFLPHSFQPLCPSVKHKNPLCCGPVPLCSLSSWAETQEKAEGKKRNSSPFPRPPPCFLHQPPFSSPALRAEDQTTKGLGWDLRFARAVPALLLILLLRDFPVKQSLSLITSPFKSLQQPQRALQRDFRTVQSCTTINFPAGSLLLALTRHC